MAPGGGSVERRGGVVERGGEVDVADVLACDPGVLDFAGRVAVTECLVEAFPAVLVEAFAAHQEQLADPVERVALPAAVADGGLLDALAALGDGLAGETHDVEPVDHDRHLGEQVVVEDRGAVSLVRIDGHDLDPFDPVGGLFIEPALEIAALRPSNTSMI